MNDFRKINRAEMYKARHEAREYDRGRRAYNLSQWNIADYPLPYRGVRPDHYWDASELVPLVNDRLESMAGSRKVRAEQLRRDRSFHANKIADAEAKIARDEAKGGRFWNCVASMEREYLAGLKASAP